MMTGMGPKHQRNGTLVYIPIGEYLEMVGPEEIRVYIPCHQNTVAQYMTDRPIIGLCMAAERNPGLRLSRRWWKQPDLDILGTRAGHAAAEGGKKKGTEESEED